MHAYSQCFLALHLTWLPTPAITTAYISPVCPKCGTTGKSGKLSCCGRGGSWFGNCGNAENTKFGHTWYEGIQSCKSRQFPIAVGKHVGGSKTKGSGSSDDNSTSGHWKAAFVAPTMLISSPNMITPSPDAWPITVPANTSMTMVNISFMTKSRTPDSASLAGQECENLLQIVAHISVIVSIFYLH